MNYNVDALRWLERESCSFDFDGGRLTYSRFAGYQPAPQATRLLAELRERLAEVVTVFQARQERLRVYGECATLKCPISQSLISTP